MYYLCYLLWCIMMIVMVLYHYIFIELAGLQHLSLLCATPNLP